MTEEQLSDLCGSPRRAAIFAVYLSAAMECFDITTIRRQAMFLAQVMHESMVLSRTREIASGKAYEGRRDLGNTEPGDGPRYKGAGLLQITGRANFAEASRALFGDDRLLINPELLTTPQFASYSAAWWWKAHGLNDLADMGNFRATTRRINGAYNGEPEREAYYKKALQVL